MRKFILTSSLFLFVLFSLSYFIKINILSSIFYGSVVSFLNCIGINLVTKMFLNRKKGKILVFLSSLLKIALIASVTIILVEYLSLDLIGFLSGFSVILIVFILLIQGK
tara:strand:+ start:72 stop:398 length:327 start_codon:yes stop_codon:yes gene_type:complete